MNELDKLRFPIGNWIKQESYTLDEINRNIQVLIDVPESLKNITNGISESEENLTYRPNGWSVKQVVNHLVDSHINSYIRFKFAATESTPTIKPYDENMWALTNDYKLTSVEDAVLTLKLIQNRKVALFETWREADWSRDFIHPERTETLTVAHNLSLYAWHSKHHLAHVKLVLNK